MTTARWRTLSSRVGIPIGRVSVAEPAFGMYFRRTGGARYQRGTNENTNGLVRQFFPKGTDFHTVTHAEAREVQNLLNHRPRAVLRYRTPYEVFHGIQTELCCD